MILGILGGLVVLAGAGALLYFFVFSGDEEEASYCTLLEDNVREFAEFTEGEVRDPDDVEEAVSVIHEIREAAPEPVVDEWAALDDPLQEFQQVIDDAGLTWQELNDRGPGEEIPDEVDEAAQKMSETFFDLDFSAMSQTINDHAKEECGIDLEALQSPATPSATPPS